MSEEDKAKLAAEKEKCKIAEKEFFNKYGDAISAFKRNFYGSPIEMALDKYAKGLLLILEQVKWFVCLFDLGGANESSKLEYVAREGEAIWILPSSKAFLI